VSPDRHQLRVRIALSDLQTGPSQPLRIKVNLVTADDLLRPLDALGSGATERFGFVTLALRRETHVTITHPRRRTDPAFDITRGSIQVTIPMTVPPRDGRQLVCVAPLTSRS